MGGEKAQNFGRLLAKKRPTWINSNPKPFPTNPVLPFGRAHARFRSRTLVPDHSCSGELCWPNDARRSPHTVPAESK